MKIDSLKATLGSSKAIYNQVTLNIEGREDITKLKSGILPAAYIIRNGDIPRICESAGTRNRGIKDSRKALSRYLLGRNNDEVRAVDGNFNNTGSLKKGINAFLRKAKGQKNIYFIGANKKIFEQLWDESAGKKKGDEFDETQFLKELMDGHIISEDLKKLYVGESEEAERVRAYITIAANNKEPVMILGDTGTGKEVVARGIHKESKRTGQFKAVNCGAIPTELFESEIFGYESHSFTGAGKTAKIGAWEAANKGTLFLDEIGELPLHHQVKILRTLDQGSIIRIGGVKEIPVDARIIAATNRDLPLMVKTGQFREDLYYRLRGLLIRTHVLRDHLDDIPLLAEFFWENELNKADKKIDIKLPRKILNRLKGYSWPGNARELKLVISRLYSLYRFKADSLSSKGLSFIFHQEGQCQLAERETEKGIEHLRADCWRHLRKADDVIRAAQHSVELFKKTGINEMGLIKDLGRQLAELEMLCRKRLLFYSEQTFSFVLRFKERLAYFLRTLKEDVSAAMKYRKDTLDDELKAVLSAVFRESERVLGNR